MTDTIFIKDLTIHAHHGVMEHEAHVGQRFEIDLELDIDLQQASSSDKLADTVSYAAIADVATQAFTQTSYRLIEAAGGRVAEAVLSAFPQFDAVKVTVHKPHAPIAALFSDVGVVLTRRRNS